MSFKDTMPGASKGIAKSAIKSVTANRNPNRKIPDTKSQEELDKEEDERNEELRARFDETVAREFGSKDYSLERLRQQQQQNQMAQLAAMQRGAGAGGFQMPKLPSGGSGGGTPKSNGSSGANRSNPQKPQELKKPDLIDEKKENNPRISPLQQPGQSQSSDSRSGGDSNPQPAQEQRTTSPELSRSVAADAETLTGLRSLESPQESQARSNQLLSTYTQNQDKHSLADHEVRRLVKHDIPFSENFFSPQNTAQQNDDMINNLISTRNTTALARLGNGPEIAKHYKSLGFSAGDYSQLSPKQFKESFDYIQQVRNDPSTRADKQALIILPEKGVSQFDMTSEVEQLKELGFTPVFTQFDSEKGFMLHNEDGSRTPIKELADDLQGFDLVVIGGHGQNSKTPGIRFGDKRQEGQSTSEVEMAYLDATDFRNDSHVREFFQDRSILKEGGTIASCSCSFTGSNPERDRHISPEESMASIIQDIRPDADILGSFDEVRASDSVYSLDEDGKLQNTTMRRLDEEPLTLDDIDELLGRSDEDAQLEEPDLINNISEDDIFDVDYEDE